MMKKIKIFILSLILHPTLFFLFRTNRWVVVGYDKFKDAIQSDSSIMLCSWHERFLYAVYFLKIYKIKNVSAVSSTHPDSQIMAHFLKRSTFSLIKGSSTRGCDNVIKKMIKTLQNPKSIVAITNDGPKGPPRIAKLGSYKIAIKSKSKIISISCSSTNFWTVSSWDKLRIPKPFGTIYIEFSDPMIIEDNNPSEASLLTGFLNQNLNHLDKQI